MKFLTFVDSHQDKKVLKALLKRASQNDIDFIICAGDFTDFGRGVHETLKPFNSLKKPFYFIQGNHEENIDLEEAAKKYEFCHFLHKKVLELENYIFCFYGGGGFAQRDSEFRKVAREWYSKYNGEKIALITHMGPVDTKLDLLPMGHVGSIDIRKFIERIKPKLVVCGHLHETAGLTDEIGKTKMVQPGWDGMVIELK